MVESIHFIRLKKLKKKNQIEQQQKQKKSFFEFNFSVDQANQNDQKN